MKTRPAAKNRAEEIVREIAGKLYAADPEHGRLVTGQAELNGIPPKEAKTLAQYVDEASRTSIEAEVRGIINELRQLNELRELSSHQRPPRPLWGYYVDNVRGLKGLRDHLDDAKKALASLPDAALVLLATSEIDETRSRIPDARVRKNASVRLKRAVAAIDYLMGRCDELIKSKPGKHRLSDYRQELAVDRALEILRCHKRKATTNPTGLLIEISSLLHEAVTGKSSVDMTPACKTALRGQGKLDQSLIEAEPNTGHLGLEDVFACFDDQSGLPPPNSGVKLGKKKL